MINRVIIYGKIVSDIELRTTPSGKYVVNFRIAHKRGGETFFFTCVAWDKLVEFLYENAHKGKSFVFDGRLEQRKYRGADGTQKEHAEIVVEQATSVEV